MLTDIYAGVKGSEGTITLSPDDARELLAVMNESNFPKSKLQKASSSTKIVCGSNKDLPADHENCPDGTFVDLFNGGVEISCMLLNEIMAGANPSGPSERSVSPFSEEVAPTKGRKKKTDSDE